MTEIKKLGQHVYVGYVWIFSLVTNTTHVAPRVATMMGHIDWTMIAKTYSKWMPEAMPQAGNKAEELFG